MGDKQTILNDADAAYADLRQSLDALDETHAGRTWLGTWGVREIVVHAAGWLREMTPALTRLGRGEPASPPGVSYDDADGWNARFVEARRGVKLADALAELETSHRDFVAAARALGDEHFAPGASARGLVEGCTSQHYAEHAGQIRAWRQATM